MTFTAVLTSCIGPFHMTGRLLEWNKNLHCKFVNELVFVALWILPVYEVSILLDAVVLNTIDFWSAPGAPGFGSTQKVKGKNGSNYTIYRTEKGYTVINETANGSIDFSYSEDEKSWYIETDNEKIRFLTFTDNDQIIILPTMNENLIDLSKYKNTIISEHKPEVSLFQQ